MTHIKRFNQINESNEENISNDSEIRRTIKYALENMYMFGGMPKPDPKYDLYMNKMIEMIMNSIKEKYKE